jgi:hypothetical protein
MPQWIGGSCPAMVNQVVEGFVLLSAANLRGFLPGDLTAFRLELEKALRAARAEVPPQDDALALQGRNRKIARISSALQVVQNQISMR